MKLDRRRCEQTSALYFRRKSTLLSPRLGRGMRRHEKQQATAAQRFQCFLRRSVCAHRAGCGTPRAGAHMRASRMVAGRSIRPSASLGRNQLAPIIQNYQSHSRRGRLKRAHASVTTSNDRTVDHRASVIGIDVSAGRTARERVFG